DVDEPPLLEEGDPAPDGAPGHAILVRQCAILRQPGSRFVLPCLYAFPQLFSDFSISSAHKSHCTVQYPLTEVSRLCQTRYCTKKRGPAAAGVRDRAERTVSALMDHSTDQPSDVAALLALGRQLVQAASEVRH